MTFEETMSALEAAGTEQNRKVYARHGVREPMFGVSYAALGKLHKRIKTDQALAEQLWATGNHDARILATRIASPKTIQASTLEAWARDLDNYVITDAFANLVAATPHANEKVEAWRASKGEWIGRAGWLALAIASRSDRTTPPEAYEARVAEIEARIHQAPNRTRDAMNAALIAIGARGEPLTAKAIAAARRIGKVEVDHGETGCKTPDAEAYIIKTLARKT
jgi:3-methyladenine DNA glycosylase AlkD